MIVGQTIVFLLAFFYRLINLNYNSPFKDEATNIVIGQMGLFSNDWWSLAASQWFGGNLYFYPVIAVLTAQIGGIVGTRFFNVCLFMLVIFITLKMLPFLAVSRTDLPLIRLLVLFFMAFMPLGFYLSRLATYDLISWLFMLLAFSHLIQLSHRQTVYSLSRAYFYLAVFSFFSVAFKYTALIYLPLIFLTALVFAVTTRRLRSFLLYYLLPLSLLTFFATTSLRFNPLPYTANYLVRSYTPIPTLLSQAFLMLSPMLPLSLFGALGLFLRHKYRLLFRLSFLAGLIILPHLLFHRLPTFDKHLAVTEYCFILIASLGIPPFITQLKKIKPALIYSFAVATSLSTLLLISTYPINFEKSWVNTSKLGLWLNRQVKTSDLILSQSGSPIMLALEDKVSPLNITTFEWFEYLKETSMPAYTQAIQDGYFEFIELSNDDPPSDVLKSTLLTALQTTYHPVYEDSSGVIYQRRYE